MPLIDIRSNTVALINAAPATTMILPCSIPLQVRLSSTLTFGSYDNLFALDYRYLDGQSRHVAIALWLPTPDRFGGVSFH